MLCLVANAQVFQYGIKAGMNLSGESDHEYPASTFEGSGYTTGSVRRGAAHCIAKDAGLHDGELPFVREKCKLQFENIGM